MEDNNIHTSVVIELANPKGEPEEKKSYQIDIDNMNTSKDFVIDQIFCGENVTVYALFEVPENENINLDTNFIEVSNSNIEIDNGFNYKNSFKRIMNEKKLNGYNENSSIISSKENLKCLSDTNSRKKSLYCLKHLSGDYDLLTPERKKSDVKVLYKKNFSLEKSKSSKFKAISIGVNTDIVQSPRIIEEVQKVLGVNVPLIKFKEKAIETTNFSSAPANDIRELEVRPSFSSLASSIESKNFNEKSVSNLFFVPLLMMEDDDLSKFSNNNSSQKNTEKEKLLNPKDSVSKVSFGINTNESDFDSTFELNKKRKQNKQNILNFENSENICQFSETEDDQNMNKNLKHNERKTILKEIKTMQLKLSALIKNIESTSFESDSKEYELAESGSIICNETKENCENKNKCLSNTLESFERNKKNCNDQPVFFPWNCPIDHKTLISNTKNEVQDSKKVEKNETILNVIEPVFSKALPGDLLLLETNERIPAKKTANCSKVSWKSSRNSKTSALSKSVINLNSNIKHNCLRKSLSLDFRDIKTEIFKNIKNLSVKQERSLKTSVKGRILQNNEVHSGDNESLLKCEVRDGTNKSLNVKISFINSSQENKKEEIQGLIEIDSDEKKFQKKEDFKFDKPKKNELSITFDKVIEKPNMTYTDSNIAISDGLLSPKKKLCFLGKEIRPSDKTAEGEKKNFCDSDKLSTPNGNLKKIITSNCNKKEDLKLVKKTNNRYKVADTTIKTEIPCKKVTVCRKPTKINAESKLHINKLIKPESLNNHKVSNIIKSNLDEKSVFKGDRSLRPSSQKHETRGNLTEVLNGSNKESESKCFKKKSALLLQVDTPAKNNCSRTTKVETVEIMENDNESASQKQNRLQPESSKTLVKLVTKKPKSAEDFYSKLNQEPLNLMEISSKSNATVRSRKNQEKVKLEVENMKKSIVKSVWALTKVLLFEDGTKKLEVLEASLTPPEYFLNQSMKSAK